MCNGYRQKSLTQLETVFEDGRKSLRLYATDGGNVSIDYQGVLKKHRLRCGNL